MRPRRSPGDGTEGRWPRSRVAACTWSLPGPFEDTVAQVQALGFDLIDVEPNGLEPTERVRVRAAGLVPSCLAIDHLLPNWVARSLANPAERNGTLSFFTRALDQWAEIGGAVAYVLPRKSPDGDAGWPGFLAQLAEIAAERSVRFCVEHAPFGVLETPGQAVAMIRTIAHPNLGLLLDVGHCLLSGDDVVAAIRESAATIGYVHLNDNDGVEDRHWVPGRGVLGTRLPEVLAALTEVEYRGPIGLELDARGADPDGQLASTLRLVTSAPL